MGKGKNSLSLYHAMTLRSLVWHKPIGTTYDLSGDIQEAVCVFVVRTLTLKVWMVPSSSWTKHSRSGFGMSVTTVTLCPSQDKVPALRSSLRGDLETHTTTKQCQMFSGCCQWEHLPWHCVVSNKLYSVAVLHWTVWVMYYECKEWLCVCLCNSLLFGLGLNMPLSSHCCSPPVSLPPFTGNWMVRMLNIFSV